MTASDLGASWLSSTPDGAVVVRRAVTEYRVAGVSGGHIAARPVGRRRLEYFDTRLVAERDVPLVAPGARFWLVEERGRGGGGGAGIAFRRLGVSSPERAFANRAGATT